MLVTFHPTGLISMLGTNQGEYVQKTEEESRVVLLRLNTNSGTQ